MQAVRNAVIQRIELLDANFLAALHGYIQVSVRARVCLGEGDRCMGVCQTAAARLLSFRFCFFLAILCRSDSTPSAADLWVASTRTDNGMLSLLLALLL